MLLSLLFANPALFILIALALVMTLTVHECAHAFVADRLGDPTPRYMGRLSLNPMAHLDPVGTVMMLILSFGWGKPVGINSANFQNPRRDSALVALAGPLSNILFAIVFAILAHLLYINSFVASLFAILVQLNLGLAFFNLLPVYPLDGFNVVYGILPINLAWQWGDLQKYGVYILLILIATRSTGYFIFPLVDFSLKLLGF
jgi:Zn-dependent protease